MTIAVVQMWGNTRAVRIPKLLAEQSGLRAGASVELVPSAKGLLVRPAKRRRKYKLSRLLAGCKGPNPHREAWPRPSGKELI